jgi:hypothetical protein
MEWLFIRVCYKSLTSMAALSGGCEEGRVSSKILRENSSFSRRWSTFAGVGMEPVKFQKAAENY